MAFLLELSAFTLIPAIVLQKEEAQKITGNENLIPDRAYPAMKSVIFQKLIPENIFPDPL